MNTHSEHLRDEDELARVKPVTLDRYRAVITTLASWRTAEKKQKEEWDDLLMEIKRQKCPSRSQKIGQWG